MKRDLPRESKREGLCVLHLGAVLMSLASISPHRWDLGTGLGTGSICPVACDLAVGEGSHREAVTHGPWICWDFSL